MSLKILGSPSRYVQGKDALKELGGHLKKIGQSPLLVADDTVWPIVEGAIKEGFDAEGLEVARISFSGHATRENVKAIEEKIKADGHDIVVAVGGGSVTDSVKAAGYDAGVRFCIVPTAASSDAPCSALSVIYTEEGEFLEYRFFPNNPDLVLIDTRVVANAPVRFLQAGIGDALATWPEARATNRGTANNMHGGRPSRTGVALAELCWDILWEYGLAAVDAVRANTVTPALEAVVEANTLLSGLGFESGGLAAAHAIHNGLTAAPSTHSLTHGQKVNIGTLTQLILEGAEPEEIENFIIFTTKLELPNTLTEIGLTEDDEGILRAVAEAACLPSDTMGSMWFEVTPDDVYEALRSIEQLSRRVRAENGLPEPTSFVD